jgi:hypothetical protein
VAPPAEQADIRWIKRRATVLQLDDMVCFEVGRMLAAGLAELTPFELELGDQATPSPAAVGRLIGFWLWVGGPGVDDFRARRRTFSAIHFPNIASAKALSTKHTISSQRVEGRG